MHRNKLGLFLASALLFAPLASCKEETKVNLLKSLEDLKAARNYTVVNQSSFTSEVLTDFLSFAYFTEDAYFYRIEQEESSNRNGLINSDEGVYHINYDGENLIPSKVDYKCVKNDIKSFWDKKYDKPGYQDLDLRYIGEEDVEYTFRPKEFLNKQAIFTNTGLNFSYYLSSIKQITVSINENKNIQFDISLGEHGSIKQEVIDLNNTKISEIDEFLANGGGPKPSVLTESQQNTIDLINANNYTEVLGEIEVQGELGVETIQRGSIYYTPNYYYIDYSDEYIDLFYDEYKERIFDAGYYQDGTSVQEFKMVKDAMGGERFSLVGDPILDTTVPEVAGYLSTNPFVDAYVHAQYAELPVSGGYLPFYEIVDYDIAKDFAVDVLHLDENNFQDQSLLMASYSAGITDVVEDNLVLLYAFSEGVSVQYYANFYEQFGKTKFAYMENYLENLHK